jgi:hypothetical protein
MSAQWTDIAAVAGGATAVAALADNIWNRRKERRAKLARESVEDVANSVFNVALAPLRDEMTRRFDTNDAKVDALDKRLDGNDVLMAQQFGGNSHGIRQEVNEIRHEVGGIAVTVSNLVGRLDQHLSDESRR